MNPNTNPVRKKANVKVIVILVAAVLLCGGIAGLVVYLHGLQAQPAKTVDSDDALIQSEGGSSRQFPVSFSNNSICAVGATEKRICVLTQDTLNFVSSNGKKDSPIILGYAEPTLRTAGKYGIVYDRLSGRYLMFGEKGTLVEDQSKAKSQIMTAAIAENGNYAIACRGEDSASLLTYYNKKGKVLFSWACAKEHIVSIDISENGKDLLCAALSAENGEILTKVYLLDIYETETKWEYTLNAAAAMQCSFAVGNDVIVVCNDKRVILDTKKNELTATYVYPSTLLSYASDAAGNTAIVTLKFGSFDTYEVTVLNNNNKTVYTYETDERIVNLCCKGKRIYLLTEKSLIAVNGSGKGNAIAETNGVEIGLCLKDNKVYHYSVGYLYKS